MSEERLQKIEEELAKISFSNIGHCVNTNLILDYITNLCKEIERLNNILNELEKDLEDKYYGRGEYAMDSDVIGITDILDKIKELRGDSELKFG